VVRPSLSKGDDVRKENLIGVLLVQPGREFRKKETEALPNFRDPSNRVPSHKGVCKSPMKSVQSISGKRNELSLKVKKEWALQKFFISRAGEGLASERVGLLEKSPQILTIQGVLNQRCRRKKVGDLSSFAVDAQPPAR